MIPVIVAIGALFWAGCSSNKDEEEPQNSNPGPHPSPKNIVVYNPTPARGTRNNPQNRHLACQPDPCASDTIIVNPADPTKGTCVTFKRVSGSDYGLDESVKHHALSLADVDGDGNRDLYVMNEDAPDQLYRQMKNGFQKISYMLGQVFGNPSGGSTSGASQHAACHDYDGDGDEDLFLVTHDGSRLYRKEAEVFVPITGPEGIANNEPGKTALWIGEDVLLATENGTKFYRYMGGDKFIDQTEASGLKNNGDGAALVAGDFTGDGVLDVYMGMGTGMSLVYRGLGDGRYEAVADNLGIPLQDQVTDAQIINLPDQNSPSLSISYYETNPHHAVAVLKDGVFVDRAGELGLHVAGPLTRVAWTTMDGSPWPVGFFGKWQGAGEVRMAGQNSAQSVLYQGKGTAFGMDEIGPTVDAEWTDVNGDKKQDLIVLMQDGAINIYENTSHELKLCP